MPITSDTHSSNLNIVEYKYTSLVFQLHATPCSNLNIVEYK